MSLLWSFIPVVSHLYVRCVCMRQCASCQSRINFMFCLALLDANPLEQERWLNKNACVLHCDIGPASHVGLEVLVLPVSFVPAFRLFRMFLHDLANYVGHYFGLHSHHFGCQGPRQTFAPATTKANKSSCGQNMTSCDN